MKQSSTHIAGESDALLFILTLSSQGAMRIEVMEPRNRLNSLPTSYEGPLDRGIASSILLRELAPFLKQRISFEPAQQGLSGNLNTTESPPTEFRG